MIMVSVMDKDFEMEKEKSRVSSEVINDDDINLNEEIRVSNEVNYGDDINLKEEIRVSSGYKLSAPKSNEEIRVLLGEGGEGKILGGYHGNGVIGEVEGGRVSSSKGGVEGEIVVEGEKLETVDLVSGENEMGRPETSMISGTKKSKEVEKGKNDIGNSVALGSVRKGKSSLLEKSESEGEVGQKGARKGKGSHMDGRDEDFKLERRMDLGAEVGKKFFGIDINGSVMRSVSAKVLDTEFEMGDMVWGKVKSHPWWPGHLFNEAFASPSVRRTRRDGHILVAFFGDSSYGWFGPDELVPYDPHYAENSQQTTSRNFVRAVEESIDEASRKSALGLSCYCRNPYNFRPADVPGYLAVDIADFDPGTVYSVSQIQKARDSFHPAETLSFIHELAAAPIGNDSCKSLDFVKNKATALAYRRSIFEEFDETYAEAFGHKPERPQLPPASTIKEPSRAPLSGPLVFADTLGGRKSSTKAMKPKEQSKKNRYFFKRRDESGDSRTAKMSQGHGSPSSSTYEDGMSNSTTGSYVFQKRDQAASNNDLGESPVVDQLAGSGYAVTSEATYTTGSILTSVPRLSESESGDVRRVSDKSIGIVTSSDAGNLDTNGKLLKKKKKATKRPASESSSEKPEPKEKKAKKPRKAEKLRSSEHPESHSAVSGGPVSIRDDTQASHLKKDVEATNSVPQQVGLVPWEGDLENEAEVRQILADLHGIALNPFHGMERNGPAIARQFFLKFRSLVFLKSCSASGIPESEPAETWLAESPGSEVADRLPTKSSKTIPSLKPSKISARRDESTKGERKRIPSERQEENAAKRVKKITEKRALLKNPELQRSDGNSKVSAVKSPQSKPINSEQHGKKAERSTRVKEPTYLVMKFPSGSSLPSLMELKAKFTRFGPLDTSLSRVFYKTNTCRVAFLFKQDAHVAYRYVVGSKSVFWNVTFMLKPVAGPDAQLPNSGRAEDLHGEPGSKPDPYSAEPRPAVLAVLPQSGLQLKSCLKKPSVGDESGGPNNGGGGTRTARVRFNIGEEKSSASNRGELQVKLVESRNPVVSSSSSSSSVAMDVSNKQRLLSSHPLEAPLLPLPQFVRPPINHHPEMAPRNNFHENLTNTTTTTAATSTTLPDASQVPPPPPQSVDISQQMMSLLTRCHDVVTNVKSILGYVPYHSL